MKRISCLAVLLILLLSSSVMAMGSLAKIPPPQAGLVLLINRNIGAYANCFLFEGRWSRRDLLIVNPGTGGPAFATSSLAKFKVSSAPTEDFHSIRVLKLRPNTSYTLFVIWTRINTAVLGVDLVGFRTSSDPFRDPYIDPLGRKIWTDKVIYLPRVRTRSLRKVRLRYDIDLNELLRR